MVFADFLRPKYANLDQKGAAVLVGSLLFIFVCLTKWIYPNGRSSGEAIYLSPPKQIQYFTFGLKEQGADALWLRSIQDIDHCEHQIAKQVCRGKSWLFQIYDVASDLSPQFRMVYAIGTMALSILVGDAEGADILFTKGLREFPNDAPMFLRAAYHSLYEINDKEKAAQYLIRAGQAGAPPWTFTLAGRLYTDSGMLDLAEKVLADMRQTNQDESFIQRLEAKIQSYKDRQRSPATTQTK